MGIVPQKDPKVVAEEKHSLEGEDTIFLRVCNKKELSDFRPRVLFCLAFFALLANATARDNEAV